MYVGWVGNHTVYGCTLCIEVDQDTFRGVMMEGVVQRVHTEYGLRSNRVAIGYFLTREEYLFRPCPSSGLGIHPPSAAHEAGSNMLHIPRSVLLLHG